MVMCEQGRGRNVREACVRADRFVERWLAIVARRWRLRRPTPLQCVPVFCGPCQMLCRQLEDQFARPIAAFGVTVGSRALAGQAL